MHLPDIVSVQDLIGRAAKAAAGIGAHLSRIPGFELWRYILRRLVQAVPVIVVVLALNFVLMWAAPGDPSDFFVREDASPEARARIRAELGLDKPLPEQLGRYVGRVLRLDLGQSLYFRESVIKVIMGRVPATLLLAGIGLAISSLVGVLVGAQMAYRANSLIDNVGTFFSLAGYSLPMFWLGQLLLIVFALKLGWFPSQGMVSIRVPAEGWGKVVDVLRHLILPAITYTVYPTTVIYRLARVKMQDTLVLDFITTARAKGLSDRRTLYRHALPHVLLLVLTVIGYDFGYLLAGSILVETVFGWPGMGRVTATAVLARDYPLLLGLFLVTTIMVVVANMITDILYAKLDPRVTYGRQVGS